MLFQRITIPLFALLYVLLALYIMSVFIPGSGYGTNNSWPDEARPPVAYRVLMPAVTEGVRSLIPDGVARRVTPALASFRDSAAGQRLLRTEALPALLLPLADGKLFDGFIQMCVVYLSLLAFIAMLYTLTEALFPESPVYALLAPLLFLLLLPVFISRYAYTYDFAELFFSCATLYLLFIQRWWLYLGCFVLATLNKETSLFVMFFFAVWFFMRMPRKLYAQLLIAQLVLYVVVKLALAAYFADRLPMYSGTSHMDTFLRHMAYLYGYSYYSFICGIITLCLILYRWQEKPAFLLGGLWMVVPNVGAYVLACNVGEYRDLFWCMPVLVILATHTLVTWLELDQLPMFQQENPPA